MEVPEKIIGVRVIVQIGNQLGVNKMDNYTKWLSAIFEEMNELFPRELEIARINVNRRLRGEEE